MRGFFGEIDAFGRFLFFADVKLRDGAMVSHNSGPNFTFGAKRGGNGRGGGLRGGCGSG